MFSHFMCSLRFAEGGVTGCFTSQEALMSVSPWPGSSFSYALIPSLAGVPACTLYTMYIVLNHYVITELCLAVSLFFSFSLCQATLY